MSGKRKARVESYTEEHYGAGHSLKYEYGSRQRVYQQHVFVDPGTNLCLLFPMHHMHKRVPHSPELPGTG